MGLPKIDINLTNGSLGGIAPQEDGIMGLVATGVAIAGKLNLNQAYTLHGLEDAEKLGIDQAYDKTHQLALYRHLRAFYQAAGIGTELWIYLVSSSVTMEQMVDSSKKHAKALLDKAGGRIKVLGVVRTPPSGQKTAVTSGMDDEVKKALVKAQALAVAEAGVSQQGTGNTTGIYRPIRIILEGRAYQGNPTTLPNLKEGTANRVAILLGSDLSDKAAGVGLALGKLASIPVQRNIGRVKDGDVGINEAYLSDGVSVLDKSIGELNTLHDKGYILLRKYDGKSGFYFSDDPTATANSDDYNSLSRGRAIDKVIRLVYRTYVEELLDEVSFQADGTLNPAMVKALEGKIENGITQQMIAQGELSQFSASIDPKQRVLSTGNLAVVIQALPVGSLKTISVELGFVTKIKN